MNEKEEPSQRLMSVKWLDSLWQGDAWWQESYFNI